MSHAISDVTHNTRVHGSAAPGSARAFQSYIYYYIAISAKSLLCRPHWASVPDNKVTSIFITNSLEREWPSRISALVNIPVNGRDQFPHHVCSMCLMQDIILEKASVNLASFKRSARSFIEQAPQPIKTRKETSGEVNVPPTLSARGLSPRYQGDSLFQVKLFNHKETVKALEGGQSET